MKPFQIVFVGALVLIIIISVFVFANSGNQSAKEIADATPVVIWGTAPKEYFTVLATKLSTNQKVSLNVDYVEKDQSTFQQELLEALADGKGPDMLLLGQDNLLQNLSRFTIIPYKSYPQRQYQDTFISEANLFGTKDGYAAIPFIVDPIVMYYNKDTLIANNIVLPPAYWDELITIIPKVSNIDTAGYIKTSALALGEYSNLQNAKDILSMIFLQSGDQIASYSYDSQQKEDVYSILLNKNSENGIRPGESALNFFTQFSDPVKTTYSWNGSLSSSTDEFLSGNTAFYLGFASEEATLQSKNPNLNFDIATVPQSRSSGKKVTFGKLYGLSVLKSSKNQTNAFNQLYTLTSSDVLNELSSVTNLPPVRLSLLQAGADKADMSIFYTAALQSQGWLEIDPAQTDNIFKTMVESITSGRTITSEALSAASLRMSSVVKQ